MRTTLSLKSIVFISIASIVLLISGCSNLAQTYQENPGCKTRVTGEFLVDVRYLLECPAIVIRDYGNFKTIPGKLITLDSNGATFLATSGIFEGEKKFYKKNDIACVVDSSGKAIYGTIPPRYCMNWDVVLELLNTTTGDDTELKFEANRKFDYCVPAGVYKVMSVSFQIGETYKDEQELDKLLTLNLQKGKINSLGKVVCDSKNKSGNIYNFTCFATERKSDATTGVMFGLVGLAIAKGLRSGDVIQHNLELIPDEKLPENMSVLTFTK